MTSIVHISPSAPDWVKHAVFYQIFPDRFARSPRIQHPLGITFRDWGAPPAQQGYQGGDLLGIVDRLDYLQDLGVNALYLNPVFASASNHRYHTYDYFQVDPLLGGDAALRELLDAAHSRDMRVVLDGVFNHASRGFWPFHHVLENGGDSPYVGWFYIEDWPLHPYPATAGIDPNYGAWWGLHALPKLNVTNPGMREYLLRAAAYWMEFGADGWRLDVPEEIDDAQFWREFRRRVRDANPEAYLVGEIWHDAQEWLRGDRFDGIMNYVFSRAALGFFGSETLRTDHKPGGYELTRLSAADFAATIEHSISIYDLETVLAQLNLLDSHDTARALWILGEDESALRLCVLFQMTMPGAPCIYYGDEIGLSAGTDPDCRGAFPWGDQDSWNSALRDHYRRAIRLRSKHIALRSGRFRTVFSQDGIYGFIRSADAETILVLLNANHAVATISLDGAGWLQNGDRWLNEWGRGEYVAQEEMLSHLRVPARDAIVLVRKK
ncbi:MAG: glycoside hydrolase family 13 protein [Caldilineaceae bacterium]|jgi:neopullulanase